MSSNAACALARTTRASPQICSHVIGFLLCGIAEEPFWPVREILRRLAHFRALQMPDFQRDLLETARSSVASVATKCACRSRWITCEATGAGFRPSRAQIFSSTSGPICANVPTAPEILPTRRSSAAASSRFRLRPASSYQIASFSPNVIGSA